MRFQWHYDSADYQRENILQDRRYCLRLARKCDNCYRNISCKDLWQKSLENRPNFGGEVFYGADPLSVSMFGDQCHIEVLTFQRTDFIDHYKLDVMNGVWEEK